MSYPHGVARWHVEISRVKKLAQIVTTTLGKWSSYTSKPQMGWHTIHRLACWWNLATFDWRDWLWNVGHSEWEGVKRIGRYSWHIRNWWYNSLRSCVYSFRSCPWHNPKGEWIGLTLCNQAWRVLYSYCSSVRWLIDSHYSSRHQARWEW